MVNKIWVFFITVGMIVCIIIGKTNSLNEIILNSSKQALDMIVKIFPVMALWLGIMNIAEKSGLLTKISTKISPLLRVLFPELKKDDPAFGFIASNIVANFFGLGNAATPFGIKTMQSLQERNSKKDTATRSMITFLVINTSGLTAIPTTIIALRMFHGSNNPTEIVLACFITTFLSTILGLLIDRIYARKDSGHD
ncbi:MAG: spore maturation protein [Bacilli bacterium]|nr:spore maturation protein [Bacilli bacterium]